MNSKDNFTLFFFEEKERYEKIKENNKDNRPDKLILVFDFPTTKKKN